MSIFDIFSFKERFQEIFNADNHKALKDVIKKEIVKQIKKNVPGQEKMDAVVNKAVDFINKHLHSKNSIVQWIIDNVLIKGIRLITQSIYDDLKEIVKLTKLFVVNNFQKIFVWQIIKLRTNKCCAGR